ncbi:Bin3-domain-containing protein [Hesseltinella vesiculosa]|uniref:RNA methyltransferase n=1 Tax=Hesseltinella vesiculosa TaxID=101127 RepID=A0A1X2GYM6_9FUNG|nr:Bin3-domain-containing protein [Hesseltinella vesiculosa]
MSHPSNNPYLSGRPSVRSRGASISLRGYRGKQSQKPYHSDRPVRSGRAARDQDHRPARRGQRQQPTIPPDLYGNYNNYYNSRRKAATSTDSRLALLAPSIFTNKTVLDIGCNSGNITLIIAREWSPAHIQGVDIDQQLITKAQSNLRLCHSLKPPAGITADRPPNMDILLHCHYFPRSLAVMFGYLPSRTPPGYKTGQFPYNVAFTACDWMESTQEKVDTILALSITKWIHLHHGDDGLKKFFQKVYDALTPGGVFVLEPQAYSGYAKRAKVQPEMQAKFEQIKFMPEDFNAYLLDTVGFSKGEKLEPQASQSKGFDRAIYLYTK